MLQIKVFTLPNQQQEANEFLKTHKPEPNGIHFNTNMIFVYFDDGEYTKEYQIASWQEYLHPARQQIQDNEIALAVAKEQIKHIDSVLQKGDYEEMKNNIASIEQNIVNKQFKINFVLSKIELLKKQK